MMARLYWLACSVTMLSIGSCCGSLCHGQEFDRRNQPPITIESTSADSAEELANDTPLPPSTDVLPEHQKFLDDNARIDSESIRPVSDPISTPPVVTFSKTVSAVERKERLPRGLLLVGKHCSPCDRMLAANLDLTGGKDAPIEVVQVEYANKLDELGVSPSMMIYGTPLLIVLGADGKIHSLTSSGFGCYLSGFHNRGEVIKYLTLPEHGVDVTQAPDGSAVVATVEGGEASPELFAAVLAAHLMESSGQETDDSPIVMGGLFDFTVEVNQSWIDFAKKIKNAQVISFPSAGLTIDWSGAKRTFAISSKGIEITPPVKMTVNKWVFRYSVGLQSVAFADDLSSVTLDLSGAPDVTINLVSRKVATELVP